MFKNRTLMIGMGIGLIVGSILLQIMLVARNAGAQSATPAPGSAAKPDEMNQQQIKELASRYFLVFDKNSKMYTQAEVDAKVQDALKAQPPATSQQGGGKKIAVYVSSGLVATQVAELLYRSGVIADRNAFENLLSDQQMTDKIQVGYHLFEGTPDPQSVIATLITRQ
jgi:hypothetical protein